MKRAFVQQFYGTYSPVKLYELTNERQRDNELVVDFINRWKNMSYACENAPPIKTLLEMCLQNISFDLSLHLTTQKFSGFDDLISKALALERRLLDHKREKRGKAVVNKMESTMVETKRPPTKLKVGHTTETSKPA